MGWLGWHDAERRLHFEPRRRISTFHPFGPGVGLIVWTITHDPITGNIYAGTEIGTHPQPYHPPFFRSTDGGLTWTNVAGTLPWHVIAAAVHPANGYIYAMTEGLGVYGSATAGAFWLPPPGNSMGLAGSMLSDPNQPSRLYAGRQVYSIYDGGAFRSVMAGSRSNTSAWREFRSVGSQ